MINVVGLGISGLACGLCLVTQSWTLLVLNVLCALWHGHCLSKKY